jgi:hypothetical protein
MEKFIGRCGLEAKSVTVTFVGDYDKNQTMNASTALTSTSLGQASQCFTNNEPLPEGSGTCYSPPVDGYFRLSDHDCTSIKGEFYADTNLACPMLNTYKCVKGKCVVDDTFKGTSLEGCDKACKT